MSARGGEGATPGTCPSCGGPLLGGDAPAPICVRCALSMALDESGDDSPTTALFDGPGTGAAPRERIGPYLLRRVLGEGGMGIVWEAEQQEPVRRRVALKCIRVGLEGGQFQARFESERQALALMSHPNIARAFDAGCTADGQPYYAMEMVDGPWITRYCDQQRLDVRRRLELFIEVCRGIQHAHQRGVIHRDIKPSNILIQTEEGRPVPKVIDFGVAKAMGAILTDRTLVTHVGQMVGTPEYMSPEQAGPAGFDVDTRTDVYSLGALLCELLTGQLPFGTSDGDPDALRHRIREDEPMRPSARVIGSGPEAVERAGSRATQPAALARALRGDLDWIVLKALSKDRARRYGTPDDLAADVGRYLANEPVLAGPPSAGYRARKFVRRHRFGVTAATLAAAGVLAFGVTMAVEARRIARERDRANAEATRAQKVSGFLENLFQSIDPAKAKGKEVTVREVLDAGRSKLRKELASEPEIEVPLLRTLGNVYRNLGAYAPAHDLLEEAVAKSRDVSGSNASPTLKAESELAMVFFREGRFQEARVRTEALLARCRTALGNEDPQTLMAMNDLGVIEFNTGRDKESAAILQEALAVSQKVLGAEHPQTLITKNNLAHAYRGLARYPEAESLCREALEAQKRVLGPDDPETLMTMDNLAGILYWAGRYPESETVDREAYAIDRRVLGEDHVGTLEALEGIAVAVDAQGRHKESRELFSQIVETQKRTLGPDRPPTLMTEGNLVSELLSLRRLDEAEALAREALETSRHALGDKDGATRFLLYNLASVLAVRGQKQQALDSLHQIQATGGSLSDLVGDPNFNSLRGDPEFDRLIAAAKAVSDNASRDGS
jgi:non-specific serine/threonine protein kinase/serine/threonine-protein kinase